MRRLAGLVLVMGGLTACHGAVEVILDRISSCSAETAFWTTERPVGAVWMDEDEWGFEPFESLVLESEAMRTRLVVSVSPGADCRPGDAIEISGYRLGYDDRGFPKQSTSTMRFRVEIVDTFNR